MPGRYYTEGLLELFVQEQLCLEIMQNYDAQDTFPWRDVTMSDTIHMTRHLIQI